jgi:hypothetical protein
VQNAIKFIFICLKIFIAWNHFIFYFCLTENKGWSQYLSILFPSFDAKTMYMYLNWMKQYLTFFNFVLNFIFYQNNSRSNHYFKRKIVCTYLLIVTESEALSWPITVIITWPMVGCMCPNSTSTCWVCPLHHWNLIKYLTWFKTTL